MLIRLFLLSVVSLSVLVGCSNKPSRIDAPSWDPDGFADAIMTKLDANTDGSVDAKELKGAPGLEWGARYVDTDKNQQLSRDELVTRFQMYKDMRLGLGSKQIQLSYKGRPLAGAKVTLVPDFYLAELIEPATGEVDAGGIVSPVTEGAEVPGVRPGYYRVVVDSPRLKVPAKYTSAESTTLGLEISPVSDDPRSYGTIQLPLTD